MMKALVLYYTLSAIIDRINSLSVRSVVSENMRTTRFLHSNLLCKDDEEYDKGSFEFQYTSYLVSFGPNVTGKYAIDVECSGSLVTYVYIVTAAHCFYNQDGSKKDLRTLTAVTGTKSIAGESSWRQYRGFAEAWIHSDYKPMSFYKDFAIGELSSKLSIGTFGVDVIYMYMPNSRNYDVLDVYWKMCTAVGFWKETGTSEVDSECVRIVHQNQCNYTYGAKEALCVGDKRTPFKEQGSPLVCYDGVRYSVLTGIMLSAVRDPTRERNWPALYARVKDFWDDTCVRLSQAKD